MTQKVLLQKPPSEEKKEKKTESQTMFLLYPGKGWSLQVVMTYLCVVLKMPYAQK